MKKVGVYTHGGCGNHGCEALIRTLYELLDRNEMTVYSQRPFEDVQYVKESKIVFCAATKKANIVGKVLNRIQGEAGIICRLYHPTIKGSYKSDVMISIGGDNYCYDDYKRIPGYLRKKFKNSTKTVLFGCSIDEKALQDEKVRKDLCQYDLITVREKLTYNLLKKNLSDVRIEYYPDSAFILPTDNEIDLPREGEFVGINMSPMVMREEYGRSDLINRIYELIEYIISDTTYNILLVPHVVWPGHDDREILKKVYDKYVSTKRIFLVEDSDCCKLKGMISKCKFFVGARTHATIAAYSSCVPTIVLGYSIKSQGIAEDLFGTEDNYVLPVVNLKKGDLVKEFVKLEKNEENVRERLVNVMPQYKALVYEEKDALKSIVL